MSHQKRIAIITGSNRGLGKAIVQYLAQSEFSQFYHVIMTGRNVDQVSLAQEEILQNIQKQKQKCQIEVQRLDVADSKSIKQFSNWFQNNFDRYDVLFNNAGVVNKQLDDYNLQKKPDQENARWTMQTNFFGTIELTKCLLPNLSQDGKILMMSSNLGILQYQGEKGKQFLSNHNLNEQDLIQAAQNYINNANQNDTTMFCNSSYHTSKALLNSYCRIVGPKILEPNQSMYAISPGWVKTDMGGEFAEETIEQSGPFLADLITKLPYGRNKLSFKFIEKMKEIDY
ncbi:oxidoreductase, short chain dehydrogenase/reductase family protein (macronuclear) [Tetrahymena thermophila SB210]|uniref:Oxidoreductase, short chain dehydrogenase/reductase family protein n=1 Tax=Tetrahymena thermophila (strain SB210) TaxID=312017 RepID=I7M4M4_TETTS|nr:oxidoreductase, short chain dehydrogenase/reductase family protein [Tetrahymena thermophila SB210]EAS07675.2 oxidoreductase, short chain dehydrogenase/reductase family protein [Tetrahymena thermophila SB210]|eukprot:XP_001027917.2 oxidoreductase, short chain dehydrogenase/reductase family protein [Tetrahymena thermophila SB210]